MMMIILIASRRASGVGTRATGERALDRRDAIG